MKLIRLIPLLVIALATLLFPLAASADEHERERHHHKPSTTTTLTAIADPTVAATLGVGEGTSSLAGGTYTVGYAWRAHGGRTLVSPTAAITIAAGQTIVVTLPAFPSDVSRADVYLSVAPGNTALAFAARTRDSTTTLSVLPLDATVTPPTFNTTAAAITGNGHGDGDDEHDIESNDDHSDQMRNDSRRQVGDGQHGDSDDQTSADD